MEPLDHKLLASLGNLLGGELPLLLMRYLATLDRDHPALQQAFADDDLASLAAVAHSAKGGAASMGAAGLAETLGRLVDAAQARDREECTVLLAQLPYLIASTRRGLAAIKLNDPGNRG